MISYAVYTYISHAVNLVEDAINAYICFVLLQVFISRRDFDL
jgi:hypothetical protein